MHGSYLVCVLAVNAAWFALGFWFFSLRARRAAELLVPRSAREETSAQALVASLPFLGGLNLGLAVLSATFLASVLVRGAAPPSWHVYVASAVAHASQWAYNVPHLRRGGRAGGAPWDVARGPMLFIFVMDASCAILNFAAVAA